MELPQEWRERALELASADNNLLDLRRHRRSLEARRRRVVELYKDGVIDRVEFDRERRIVENSLKSAAPSDATLAEVSIADFERFGDVWDAATPEENSGLLGRMMESLYVDFKTGQVLEVVPKAGCRCIFEAAEITKPLASAASGSESTIGDPEGIRGISTLQSEVGPLVRYLPYLASWGAYGVPLAA